MKKAIIVLAGIFMVAGFWSCGGGQSVKIEIQKDTYQPGEKEALTILKAHVEKDVNTLKSYASGLQGLVLNDEFFSDEKNNKRLEEKLKEWDGSFKEIRYSKEEINFKTNYYINAVICDNPNGNQYTVVALKSADKKEWKLSGFGISYPEKAEFNEMSLEIPE